MFKPSTVIAIAAALALASSAHAESTLSQFSYTGFLHAESGQFLPNQRMDGYFDSEDLNSNGTIERNEVSSFVFNGQRYVDGCGPEVFMCGLWEFSYTPGGALNFHAAWSTDPWDEAGVAGGEVISGVELQEYSYWLGNSAVSTLRWTENTTFSITPVPEPATYGMLALGLGVLALCGRYRAQS